MTAPLKAGIIGLGVGARHIAGYRAHPAFEVVAACDFADDKRTQARAAYPDLRLVAGADEILDDPSIDVVSIASWDNYHHRQIVKALDRGKHVFVEKPLVLREDEAADIRARLRGRPDLKLSSNLILRRCPRFAELRQRIAMCRKKKIVRRVRGSCPPLDFRSASSSGRCGRVGWHVSP